MSRKTPANAKKPGKAKAVTAYIVVQEILGESPSYTEPDRIFTEKKAAQAHADELNREIRAIANPFNYNDPNRSVKGGEKTFIALVKKLKLPVPKKQKDYNYIDWEEWWDRHYFDMTEAHREAIWDAQTKYLWYKVKETTLED